MMACCADFEDFPTTVQSMPSDRRSRSLALIIVCQVMAMALWFSATAVVPALKAEGGLDDFTAGLFTSAVQAGFVIGTLCFALTGVADRFDPRRIFLISAEIAALANLAILALDPAGPLAITLRLVTGICMAGIYPIGMKLAVSWAKGNVGLLVGALVGALALGSASPHLFVFAGGVDWRFTLAVASASGAIAGFLILAADEGPAAKRAARFKISDVKAYWTNRGIRYANFGYLGHMWELYAMWAWIGFYFSLELGGVTGGSTAALITFAILASGALGAVVAGWSADRFGRTAVTSFCMAASGSCALLIGFAAGLGPWWMGAVALVWGLTIVSDSAQFSASVTELSEPDRIGTMLTLQTCVGFLLTLATIQAVPWFAELLGWRHAFAPLAIGPFLGVVAMLRLRGFPEAVKLAGGRR
jgi:MFS family permease